MKSHVCVYQIRIRESLDRRWLGWFSALEIVPAVDQPGSSTLLQGSLPDQAALLGVLARLHDLNLTLLEVRRME